MGEVLMMILIGLGTLLVLLAAFGIVRMPDFYLRLSVTTKASVLGIIFILIGAAFYFSDTSVTSRVVAIIFFLVLTGPVSAHMIGRTSYFIGTKLWKRTLIDELKGQYDEESHVLNSGDEAAKPKS